MRMIRKIKIITILASLVIHLLFRNLVNYYKWEGNYFSSTHISSKPNIYIYIYIYIYTYYIYKYIYIYIFICWCTDSDGAFCFHLQLVPAPPDLPISARRLPARLPAPIRRPMPSAHVPTPKRVCVPAICFCRTASASTRARASTVAVPSTRYVVGI